MSSKFAIAETESFIKEISRPQYKKIYAKICDYIYPILKANPFFGPNIKRLRGDYSDFYRYRIGDYRLFYKIESERIMVLIVDIVHRKNAYE